MKKQTNFNELLNQALELLTELETYADKDQQNKIDKLFKIVNSYNNNLADMEVQNFDLFGKNKI